MQESHESDRTVTVTGIPCDIPMDLESETVWAAQVACMRAAVHAVTGIPVDAVVSSEKYGDQLAQRFSAPTCASTRSASNIRSPGPHAATTSPPDGTTSMPPPAPA